MIEANEFLPLAIADSVGHITIPVQKPAEELLAAIRELAYQNEEKEKRAAELFIANKELIFQNGEKEKRAAELIIANEELAYQNEEKEMRAAELIVANAKLVYRNTEKENLAAELMAANKELLFQNEEKEKRAAELMIANKELAFQNEEKEKRARELIIANKELAFQHSEKEKRAAELIIANNELIFQNEEKEKRATELNIANKELVAFTYISSHDLQEPLRKIQTFARIILEKEEPNLSGNGKDYFRRIQAAASRMQLLLEDLLAYSRINATDRKYELTDLRMITDDVVTELKEITEEKKGRIEVSGMCAANIIPFQFRQLMYNLLSNALKFSRGDVQPLISINSKLVMGADAGVAGLVADKPYCHITVADNGIGFNPEYNERIFEVFQKLHAREEYIGTGIGLAIVKKIVENHNGVITATGEQMKGAIFNIYILHS
jgi:signal transduction histidine kinase